MEAAAAVASVATLVSQSVAEADTATPAATRTPAAESVIDPFRRLASCRPGWG